LSERSKFCRGCTREPRMSHYRSNLRDIEFNLFEVLGAGEY
jgi:hypothetical protein